MLAPDCPAVFRFLIEAHWFKQCKKYLGLGNGGGGGGGMGEGGGGGETSAASAEETLDESANPGPIDNGPLFQEQEPSEIRDVRRSIGFGLGRFAYDIVMNDTKGWHDSWHKTVPVLCKSFERVNCERFDKLIFVKYPY